jgi:SAM-dependent methyltransferase
MLAEAERHHPELCGRTIHHRLPDPLPFEDASFDIVTSMAVIMHLDRPELPKVFSEVARILRGGGVFGYSVNTERAGLDDQGTDPRGRHFTCLSAREWETLHAAAGLSTVEYWETEDITGRSGIRWVTFVCRKV